MPFDLEALNKIPDLSGFLRYYRSGYGNGNTNQEMYDYFGGDDILKALQKFDPSARWNMTQDDSGNKNYDLSYDISKLPSNKFGQFLDMKPMYNDHNDLYMPDLHYQDQNWGNITHTKNVKKPTDPTWTKLAPLVPGLVAPWAAGMLAANGIGAAGMASSVTGSGVAAGKVPGFIANLTRGLLGIGANVSSGNFGNLGQQAAGMVGGALGMPNLGTAINLAKTGYNLSRSR